jgi:monoamine oxidase/UDP-galactopyranose mutase
MRSHRPTDALSCTAQRRDAQTAEWWVDEWTRPEGRIHFAGDWTTMKSGWVEGVIKSGLRAARQVDPQARP